jgi:hypothetical protein
MAVEERDQLLLFMVRDIFLSTAVTPRLSVDTTTRNTRINISGTSRSCRDSAYVAMVMAYVVMFGASCHTTKCADFVDHRVDQYIYMVTIALIHPMLYLPLRPAPVVPVPSMIANLSLRHSGVASLLSVNYHSQVPQN